MDNEKINKLQDIIDKSNNIVFFGGAGVSTESGIPDFRSTDGLYASTFGDVRPEEILSVGFFKRNPEMFFKFYKEKILMQGSGISPKPNAAHLKLAELEKAGKLKAVITQNIDMLHQMAGSKTVYQIHGNIATYHCVGRKHEYPQEEIDKIEGVPHCPQCNSILKPNIVLYDECLPDKVWRQAISAIKDADCLIVAGTSLSVYPAASLLDYFHGESLVIINKMSTQADCVANLVISDPVGEVLSQININ